MASGKRVICCCEAHRWVLVFAWLQIVLCSLAAAWFLMFIVGVSVAEVPKGKEEGRLVALVFFSIFFVTCVVGVVLGILLLFGTKKEKAELLWTWIVITSIVTALMILSSIFQALRGDTSEVVKTVLFSLATTFEIYVVHRRVVDIQDSRPIYPRTYSNAI